MTKMTAKLQVGAVYGMIIIIFNVLSTQASGEARFTTDIPTLSDELAAAFVLTDKVSISTLCTYAAGLQQLVYLCVCLSVTTLTV